MEVSIETIKGGTGRAPRCPQNLAKPCLGDACMAWRWRLQMPRSSYTASPPEAAKAEDTAGLPAFLQQRSAHFEFSPANDEDPAQWVETAEGAYLRSTGYCGLAGPLPVRMPD